MVPRETVWGWGHGFESGHGPRSRGDATQIMIITKPAEPLILLSGSARGVVP